MKQEWWPWVRIAIAVVLVGTVLHYWFGWKISGGALFQLCRSFAGNVFGLGILSLTLARFYIYVAVALPLRVLYVASVIFYEASWWLGRFLKIQSSYTLALFGMLGELSFFAAIFQIVRIYFPLAFF